MSKRLAATCAFLSIWFPIVIIAQNTPVLSISSMQKSVLLSWPSVTNATYRIQSCTSVSGPWQIIGDPIQGNGGTACYVDTGYTNDGSALQSAHATAYYQPSIGETWTNLSAWNSTHMVVSNGSIYCDGTGANPVGANRAFVIPANGEGRIVATVTMPTNDGTSAAVIVGVTSDPPGGAPVYDQETTLGIGILENIFSQGSNAVPFVFNRAPYSSDTNALSPGTYTVELAIDTSYVSLALVCPGHTNEYTQRVLRSSFGNINNLTVYISDPRGLNGFRVNALGARTAQETIGGRIGEGTADFVINTVDDAGGNISVRIPPFYDSRTPLPVYVHCHGYGFGYTDPWTFSDYARTYFQEIINAGYIVLSGDYTGQSTWGDQASINSVSNSVAYVRAHFNCGPIVLEGESMGGLTSLNTIHQHCFDCAAWVGLFPVCNLSNMWSVYNGYSNQINGAYGITGTNYPVVTAGLDPMLDAPDSFQNVPIYVSQNTDDGVVNFYSNALAFTTMVAPYCSPITITNPPGLGHGDPTNFNAPPIISFLGQVLPKNERQTSYYRLLLQ